MAKIKVKKLKRRPIIYYPYGVYINNKLCHIQYFESRKEAKIEEDLLKAYCMGLEYEE